MPQIRFEVTSKAEPLLIVSWGAQPPRHERVSLKPAGAEVRKGELDVPANERLLLTWVFAGTPGTPYQIALEPKQKITLSRGENPIKSKISTNHTAGFGAVYVVAQP